PAIANLIEERLSRQDHAGNAVAALHRPMRDERLLQRMQILGIAEPLDGHDLASGALRRKQDAGVHRLAVEQHGTHATLRLKAVLLTARESDLMAQDVQQRPVLFDVEFVALSVD